ncbi:MAG: hypothetical protein AAF961_06990, partial [Planctomycetota bacterium]
MNVAEFRHRPSSADGAPDDRPGTKRQLDLQREDSSLATWASPRPRIDETTIMPQASRVMTADQLLALPT